MNSLYHFEQNAESDKRGGFAPIINLIYTTAYEYSAR